MAVITIVAKLPTIGGMKKFNGVTYARRIHGVVEEETRIFENMYNLVAKGFSDRPRFKKEMSSGTGSLVGKTSTTDTPFVFIDVGTSERWALMSEDFSPRTTPNVLGIKGRQGKAVLRGKSAMLAHGLSARPGIQPRNFSKEIAKRRAKPFSEKVQKAIKAVANS